MTLFIFIQLKKKKFNLDFSTVLSLFSFMPQKLNEEKKNFLREMFMQFGNTTNYLILTISSQYSKFGTHHLKSWVIEISNDKKNWTVINEHSNCKRLNSYNTNVTFDVKSNDFARYIRLRQTEEPWGGNDIWFHYIEFF